MTGFGFTLTAKCCKSTLFSKEMNSMHQVAVVIDNALQAKVVVKHHPIEQEAIETGLWSTSGARGIDQ